MQAYPDSVSQNNRKTYEDVFVSLFETSRDHLTDSEAVCFSQMCLFL